MYCDYIQLTFIQQINQVRVEYTQLDYIGLIEMDFSIIIRLIGLAFIGCCIAMFVLENSHKSKRLRELEAERDELKELEYKRRFEQIYGLKYEEAYNNPKNKRRWENWVESCKNGKIHWSPSYDEYITDGWFSDSQSPADKEHISIFDDKHFEKPD